jgi:hypothetical protein
MAHLATVDRPSLLIAMIVVLYIGSAELVKAVVYKTVNS